ncbi:hypothetical protein BB559_002588 [Furculomyces boomerangus]|uniref:Dihydroorotate dehydrogenase (quinone), mitochondrial n=1 Tax=Furculomyces boomerangus TaxID=61424 RepID=A0A2T9YU03_9FUNG|nr:hypothetical protein BB559_002588 [Furculomyces boomerangus]
MFLSKSKSISSRIFLRSFKTPQKSIQFSRGYSNNPSIGTRVSNTAFGLVGIALAGFFGFYVTDSRSNIHEYITVPLMQQLDAEKAHYLSIKALSYGLGPVDRKQDNECLKTEIWGMKLSNPIGLAAGYDKNGEVADKLLDLGFGAVEVGSITPKPQEGNPRKRLFRLSNNNAAINRMGLNNDGFDVVKSRLKKRFWNNVANQQLDNEENAKTSVSQAKHTINKSGRDNRLLGINISKNHSSPSDSDQDFLDGIDQLGSLADYVVINVSCPNVTNLGAGSDLILLDKTMKSARTHCDALGTKKPALVIKLGPDYTENDLKLISELALKNDIDGIITSNTSRSRPECLKSDEPNASEMGGLSGPPIRNLSLNTTRLVYKFTNGKIPIIGCGGVSSAEDVLEYGRAGASFVQLYTGMVYTGPGIVSKIKDDMVVLLNGKKWDDIVGSGHKSN